MDTTTQNPINQNVASRRRTLSLLNRARQLVTVEIPDLIDPETGAAALFYLRPPSVADVFEFTDRQQKDGVNAAIASMLEKLLVEVDGTPALTSFEEAKSIDMRIFARLSKRVMEIVTEGTKIISGEAADAETKVGQVTEGQTSTDSAAEPEPGNASSGPARVNS